MKIGLFFPAVEYGGQEKNLVALSNALYKKNVNVNVITYDDKKFLTQTLHPEVNRICLNKLDYLNLNNLKIFNFDNMIGIHLKSLTNLYKILKSNDYSVILCFQAGGLVSLLKRITRSKTKIIIRESISPYNLLKLQHSRLRAKLLFFIKKKLYSYADMIVANSHAGIKEIKEFTKKPKLKAIENICEFEFMKIKKNNHKLFSNNKKTIIAVSRLNKVKRIDLLINSLHEINKDYDVQLVIIGDGPEENKLKNLTRELNLEENVHFLGFRDDVIQWMINSDIFVTASQVEGSPNSLIEAVCLGIPSIATDCPTGPKEILNNGEQGILIPIDSQKHMVDAMRLLIEDQDLRNKFVQSSEITRDRYSSERIVNLYLDAINSMN